MGREGIAPKTVEERGTNLHVLLDGLLEEIPPPRHAEGEPFQLLVSDLDDSDLPWPPLRWQGLPRQHQGGSGSCLN